MNNKEKVQRENREAGGVHEQGKDTVREKREPGGVHEQQGKGTLRGNREHNDVHEQGKDTEKRVNLGPVKTAGCSPDGPVMK